MGKWTWILLFCASNMLIGCTGKSKLDEVKARAVLEKYCPKERTDEYCTGIVSFGPVPASETMGRLVVPFSFQFHHPNQAKQFPPVYAEAYFVYSQDGKWYLEQALYLGGYRFPIPPNFPIN